MLKAHRASRLCFTGSRLAQLPRGVEEEEWGAWAAQGSTLSLSAATQIHFFPGLKKKREYVADSHKSTPKLFSRRCPKTSPFWLCTNIESLKNWCNENLTIHLTIHIIRNSCRHCLPTPIPPCYLPPPLPSPPFPFHFWALELVLLDSWY